MNGTITVVTGQNFETEVEKAEGLVVLDFWAQWCGPCRMLAPIMEELSAQMPDVKFCKVNVDEEFELARKYRVVSIPMLVLFKGGNVVATSVGYEPKEDIERRIETYR